MSLPFSPRRLLLVGTSAVAALVVGAAPAMAHHCFIPMYSLNGPVAENWLVFSAEDGAELEAGFTAGCEEAVAAGYAALRAERLPVGVKVFEHMTIGDPQHTGRMNPNGADGKGLEYFGAGSPVPGEVVTTFIAGATSVTCAD